MTTAREPEGKYEKTDAHVPSVVVFAVGIMVLIVVTLVTMGGLFWYFNAQADRADAPRFYLRDERWRAPDIMLEVHPSREYELFRRQEMQKMTTYGWIDREQNTVRIPVEKAMRLALEQGFPSRTEAFHD